MNRIYAGIEGYGSTLENSQVLLQSVQYDGTSTWGKGADKGFENFLNASENMEIYDIETDSEPVLKGVNILPPLLDFQSPDSCYNAVYQRSKELLDKNMFLTFFGGEHSVSIGIIDAFREKYSDLTVLQLDAHADLRNEYLGSKYNHACAMHRASQTANLIQVGIRSMDDCENQFIDKSKCFFDQDIHSDDSWMNIAIEKMTETVYITIDMDAFDPAIFPATGTPEPGGLQWYQALKFLKKVFESRNVVGFDIVEFAPIEGLLYPDFLVAKLYYKLLAYKFYYGN